MDDSTMQKILVCQHVGYEILGTLNPLLKKGGFRIRYANFGRFPHLQTSLEGYNGLIILGGPMNVDEASRYPHLKHELALIEAGMKMDIPILGICLGAQLIAKSLGAWVGRNAEKEIGWFLVKPTEEGEKDPLLKHFHSPEPLFHWHGDTFDLPRGSTHLALSEKCLQQAFRFGDKVYGFQFHLEVDEPMVERWLHVPYHQKELEALKGRLDPQKILAETHQRIRRLKELSHQCFGEFIKLFGQKKKGMRLSSH